MCRLVGWVARVPVTLEQVLGRAAVDRLHHLSQVHADGWGAGWHDEQGALRVVRSAEPARTDERFAEFATGLASRAAVVHLRLGTPGCGYGESSNHPFVDGPWALAHNGAISPGDRMDLLLPPDSDRRPRGATDTERYFLALRHELDRTGGVVPAAVDRVVHRLDEAGLTASSLNAMLLGPTALHVISWHDADWRATTIQVWPADELASGIDPPAYFPMIHRQTEDFAVTVSSGIVSDPGGWTAVPNHAVLDIDLTSRRTTTTPITSTARTH
ncbi:MAG TPA: class II glutamine amidotransferase [Pseudonocardiaceae bacterium]|jgi:predicted glutamine amidotransferase|nr:class II glutamine amidotransferase [Pseudonocardiaceae bacterium]